MALKKNSSGQYLYFTLVGVSGVITGGSGSISGRKSLDGLSGMIVLSGNVIELGGGSYRANLYDFDTNGDFAGYLFTASGAAPIQYSMVTEGGVSGAVFPASGVFVTVPPSTLSGLVANSGLFVNATATIGSGTVFLASGQAVSLNSGQSVLVYSGQLSGQPVAPLSGANVIVPVTTLSGLVVNSGLFVTVPIATISGLTANSGLFVTATATIGSGTVFLASGQAVSLNSGQSVLVYSGQLSGQPVTPRSGANVIVPPSTLSGLVANSGLFVTATATVGSGVLYLASGSIFLNTFASGVVGGGSGNLPSAWGGSGMVAVGTILSGITQVASGAFVTVPTATLSGLVANSGLFVTATATIGSGTVFLASGQAVSLNSGQSVLVYSGQLSGQPVTPASGANVIVPVTTLSGLVVNSGLFVTVPIATISGNICNSGQFVTVPLSTISGVQPISGTTVSLPVATLSGVVANSGLFVTVPIATISGVIANSGLFVTATATIGSGTVFLASGQTVNLLSGNTVQLYSGQQVIAASGVFTQQASGTTYPASGVIGLSVMQWNFSGQPSVSGQRNLQNAARKLVNRFDTTSLSGYLTVYQEDGTTIAYTQPLAVTSGAQPITAVG